MPISPPASRGRGTVRKTVVRLRLQISSIVVCAILAGCVGQPEIATPTPLPSVPRTSTPGTLPTPESTVSTQTTATPIEDAGQRSVTGKWVGGYQLPGSSAKEQIVTVAFTESQGSLQGDFTSALDGAAEHLASVSLQSGKVHFERTSSVAGTGAAVFDGVVGDHTIAGTVLQGSDTAQFAFVRSIEPPQEDYAQFAGTYRFSSGRAIGFYQTADPQAEVFATPLLYADLQTGELGAAFPVSGTTFAVGSAVGLAYPFRAEVTFVREPSGNISKVKWSQKDGPELTAERVIVNTEEVKYQSQDGITLAGRLAVPGTLGKHPAVVIVYGAGKVPRQNWLADLLSGLFAVDGIATLSYDKRGVGDSGGVYAGGVASQEDIELLGKDALAGLGYLKGRNDIDAEHIGMLGQSQAGWIIPFAAAQSSDVAFMLLWSGPGVTQGISDLYDSIAETSSRDEITQTLLNTSPTGFDPVPYLEKTSAPGFWAFGDRDMTVPVPESIANLEKVKVAGHKDFTWQTYPDADHYLFRVASPSADDLRLSPGYPPGMLNEMMRWLRLHIGVK